MSHFDICLAWNWEFDADFVALFEALALSRGITLLQVTPHSLEKVLSDLTDGTLTFSILYDRASDADVNFIPLVEWATDHQAFCINPQQLSLPARDKAIMHLEFRDHGLEVLETIILPAYANQPDLAPANVEELGERFVIKPTRQGGGEGVVLDATSWEQVLTARRDFPREKYLLQKQVTPLNLEGRPAWFRILVCDGAVYPCWWDTCTHTYNPVTAEQKAHHDFRELTEIPLRISQVCNLHLFSTELALTDESRFVVVDYVNDPIDLRLQSRAVDGVPDGIVRNIASRLLRLVERQTIHKPGKPASQ